MSVGGFRVYTRYVVSLVQKSSLEVLSVVCAVRYRPDYRIDFDQIWYAGISHFLGHIVIFFFSTNNLVVADI